MSDPRDVKQPSAKQHAHDAAMMHLQDGLADLLDRVKAMFKPVAEPGVMLVVRNAGVPDGDVVIGDIDPGEAIATIRRQHGMAADWRVGLSVKPKNRGHVMYYEPAAKVLDVLPSGTDGIVDADGVLKIQFITGIVKLVPAGEWKTA